MKLLAVRILCPNHLGEIRVSFAGEDGAPRPVTLIYGGPGSGKTSVLSAIGGTRPNSTKHEFNFAMQPAQARAFVKYRGVANAELSYQAAGSTVNFEVNERVEAFRSHIVYAHTVKPGDSIDSVSMRWIW